MVYVDDFKMSGPSDKMKEAWVQILKGTRMDQPSPVSRCLGCAHHVDKGEIEGKWATFIDDDMTNYLAMRGCMPEARTRSKANDSAHSICRRTCLPK